jgi:TatA/E family protein of Tat protein translocase
MGQLGFPELILIFVIALLVFGPKKLPELGKSLGKGLKEFKKASEELKSNWDEHLKDVEKSVDDVKKDVEKHVNDVKASVTDATKDIEDEIYKDYPSTPPESASSTETPKSESKEEVHQS